MRELLGQLGGCGGGDQSGCSSGSLQVCDTEPAWSDELLTPRACAEQCI